MLTLEEVRRRLKDANIKKVCKNSGVSYGAIARLIRGADPQYSTVERLSDYLEDKNNNE